MKRSKVLSLAVLILTIGMVSVVASQEATSPSGPQDAAEQWTEESPEFYEHFTEPDEVPLKLGDANDRVRELQASLNRELGDETIFLVQPVYVGDALGADSDDNTDKSKVRFVYSKNRQKAFVVRGDWIPLNAAGDEIKFSEDNHRKLALANAVKLPEEPLKVDGVYGQHTEAAVALFQWQQRLPVTGRVDVVTLDKLEPMVPTNPLLAMIMGWVGHGGVGPFKLDVEKDNYPYWVKTCTSLIMTLIIFLGAAVAYQIARMLASSTRFLSRWLFTPTSSPWFTALRNHRVFMLAANFAPAAFIYFAAIAIFPRSDESQDSLPYLNVFQNWQAYVSNLGLAYMSLSLMLVSFAIANTFDSVFNPDHENDNPIGNIIRTAKRLIGLIGSLMICASLAGKHPFYIIGGLGAFTAVFMLVFRDYLLGLVASIQIIANEVVRVGDWITMPKFNADGDVQRISLALIKVQNFDKTVSTIPTSSVLTESFRNWTGMRASGGRRIKRSIYIDMHSIQICTPEMIERFKKIELIRDYIQDKEHELAEYNRTHDVDASKVNSRRLTNIGTFRAYLRAYLGNHPGLTSELTFLVRHLQPTSNGLPIEIYAFCKETDWRRYEAVQADIFDHVLAILPEFGLRTFQEITDIDSVGQARLTSPVCETDLSELQELIEQENAELAGNPRRRLATSLRRVNRMIEELNLEAGVKAEGSGRVIGLRNLRQR